MLPLHVHVLIALCAGGRTFKPIRRVSACPSPAPLTRLKRDGWASQMSLSLRSSLHDVYNLKGIDDAPVLKNVEEY